MTAPTLAAAFTLATLLLSPPSVAQTTPADDVNAPTAAASAVAQSAQSAQTAITTRTYAPNPRAIAAAAASSTDPIYISVPGSAPQAITPGTVTAPGGATIIVPANAQAGTFYDAPTYEVYDPGVPAYIAAPGYSTVYEYESLIRAGRSPSYSITTLHRPYPHSRYHYSAGHAHDHAASHRYNAHNRPFSSHRDLHHGSLGYDPLGGALHRSAQLRFHEASYPRSARPTQTHHDRSHRAHADRDHSHRGDAPRHDARGHDDRPSSGRRDARPLRDSDRGPSRNADRDSGRDRSPRATSGGNRGDSGGRYRRSPK